MKEEILPPNKIDLKKIKSLVRPFEESIWLNCVDPITKEEIKTALDNNNLQSPDVPIKFSGIWDNSAREEHIKRIAWFVKNLNLETPICIDFGCGYLGGHFEIYDGNHRLLAAYYREEKYILADCSGLIELIEEHTYHEN